MRVLTVSLIALVALVAAPTAQPGSEFKIYVIDVEGGGASLFVAPSGESLLVDTGNGDAAASRDAGRILEAASDASVKQIDHLVTTHYHGDHVGGMAELASRIPIRHFIDHGPTVEPENPAAKFLARYNELAGQARHTIAKPGDTLSIPGLDIRIVTSAGKVVQSPLAGAGQPNAVCAGAKTIEPDPTENAQSVGMSIAFGQFRVAHLGDLTWNGEYELMCPNNKFGTVDLFLVSHHAQQFVRGMSNSPVLVHGLRPRVAISTNGIRKGAQPAAMKVLFSSPGLQDLWQMHASEFSGQEYTVPGMFIANNLDQPLAAMPVTGLADPAPGQQLAPPPVHNGKAYFFKVVARRDGSFSVTNTRNGFTKTYQPRK